jgi:His/Glu/Gln/Arg/opine family amino acid ABC transporter permease subunit
VVIRLNKKRQRSLILLVLLLFFITSIGLTAIAPVFADNPVVVITVKTDMFYPIPNATVYIDEVPYGMSNQAGVVALYQFPAGVHNLTAVKQGFINKTIKQDLTGGTSIDYILHDQPPVGPSLNDSMSIIVLDDTTARGTIAEAKIYIDGQYAGQTDRANGRFVTNLTGVHEVLVSKDKLLNNTAPVDFTKGGIYTFLMSDGGKKFSIFDTDLFFKSLNLELSVGAINTLKLSLLAFAIGICIGLIMGLGRVSTNFVFKTLSSIYVEGVRGLPLLLQLLFAYYAIPFMWTDLTGGVLPIDGFTACLIALSVNSGSYMGEIFKAGIEAIHKGQMEAARSLGLSYNQSMLYVILPQAVKIVLPALGNEFIALIKDSSIALIISYQDILWNAKYIGAASYNTFTPILAAGLIYLCITIPLGRIVQYMEKRLNMNVVARPREEGSGGFGRGRKKKPAPEALATLENNPEFVEVEHER